MEEFDLSYERICKKFENVCADKISIGQSFFGREIYAFVMGCGEPKIIVQYAIHAREYITYYLSVMQALDLSKKMKRGEGTLYFVPVSNPDGVALAMNGISGVKKESDRDFVLYLNNGTDFSMWKANGRGVDLNVNFDARWGTGASNCFCSGPANYVGQQPNSEPETKALIQLTDYVKPNCTLSYHTKGEVIFYDFHQPLARKLKDRKIAKTVAKTCGYKIVKTGNSAGGYKDYCIEKYKIPALTVEVGNNEWEHPLGINRLPSITQKQINVLPNLLAKLKEF